MQSVTLIVLGHAAIKEEAVTYKDGDTTMNGLIVYDDAVKGKRPGMVVVHEWWGITNHTREEARKLAQQGYTALCRRHVRRRQDARRPEERGRPRRQPDEESAGTQVALRRWC